MVTDICARGFKLTEGLRQAVELEAAGIRQRIPQDVGMMTVRLFDTNGSVRGGADKGCLVHARMGARRVSLVASAVDTDLYRAIGTAFAKLAAGARTAAHRTRVVARRRGR